VVANEDRLFMLAVITMHHDVCPTVASIMIQSSILHIFVSHPREYIRMSVDTVPMTSENVTTARSSPERSSPSILEVL
jgi:hypothetical protein